MGSSRIAPTGCARYGRSLRQIPQAITTIEISSAIAGARKFPPFFQCSITQKQKNTAAIAGPALGPISHRIIHAAKNA